MTTGERAAFYVSRFTFHVLFLCLVSCVLRPAFVHAASEMTISTYYPAPFGEYERIRLIPRSGADLLGPCTIGSLYVNSAGLLKYCYNNAGSGEWGPVTEIWTQNGDDIYLTDTPVNDQLRVGIGTSTPEFKLTIRDAPWILAKGDFGSGEVLPDGIGAGSRLIWYPRKAAFRAGYVDGAQWDDANIGNYSSAMGKNTVASGEYSVVGGGDNNVASGQHAVVIGGQNNTASGDKSGVGGGLDNTASGNYAMLYGGRGNTAAADYSLIIGGHNNQVTKTTLTPPMSDVPAIVSLIGGGEENIVQLPYSYIGGGSHNTIGWILNNTTPDGYAVIGGGAYNSAKNDYTVVLGGENNTALGKYSSIGGGKDNTAGEVNGLGMIYGAYSVISGGQSNTTGADYATITGGRNNIVTGPYSTIAGGLENRVTGMFSAIGGGERNTVNGAYSTIMGGTDNIVNSDYSWAGGRNIQLGLNAHRTFAWGYSDTPVSITAPDAFIIAPGSSSNGAVFNPRVGIRDQTPAGVLEINANGSLTDNYLTITDSDSPALGNVFIVKNNGLLSPYIGVKQPIPALATHVMQFGNASGAHLTGGGAWTSTSSRKYKENILPLSSADAEDALDKLNPVSFNYRITPDQQKAGFIAEDVPDLVAMKGREALSTMDIVAVLTKVVQDQGQEIRQQKKRLKNIREEIRDLKRKLGD